MTHRRFTRREFVIDVIEQFPTLPPIFYFLVQPHLDERSF